MIRILFVCHGNICRSPMAQFVFEDMARRRGMEDCFEVDSAATSLEEIGNGVHHGTLRKLKQEGVAVHAHYARQITREDYNYYDHIIVMERYNLSNLRRVIGEDTEHKVHMLLSFAGSDEDIADPWYTGNFDEAYDDISRGCRALLDKLTKERG